MSTTYTQFQVADSLVRQGYSQEQADSIASAMGDMRATPNQVRSGYRSVGADNADLPMGRDGRVDSTFMPNLVDGITFAGVGHLVNKNKYTKNLPEAVAAKRTLGNVPRAAARFGTIGLASNLANLGYVGLSGNNFYDRASGPQMLADMGGNIAGGMAGEAAMKAVAAKAATALAGRGIGAAAGSFLPGVGTLVGATLGGWLLPKLIPGGSQEVAKDTGKDPSDFAQYAPLASVAAGGGLLYSDRGRKMLGKLIKKKTALGEKSAEETL